MSLPQQKFREIVFQLLYSYDISKTTDEEMISLLSAELAVTKKAVRTAMERVLLIISKIPEIDKLISQIALQYNFERIQSVERNILRLGTFELFFDDAIPPKVAIAESIRLARKFGSPEAASFVNAILDNLYKTSLGQAADKSTLSKAAAELAKIEEISEEAAKQQKSEEEIE